MSKLKKKSELTKEEKAKIKHHNDAFKDAVDDFDKFEDFFSSNLKVILIAFGVIAIVLAAGTFIYQSIEKADKKEAGELTAAQTVSELEQIVKKYPNNKAVYPAQMRLATVYFKDKKYEKALAIYSKLAVKAPSGEIKNRAKLNEGYTLEVMNKKQDSADKFSLVGQDSTLPEYIRNEANYSAGRIYALINQNEKAITCLKSVDKSNNGFWAGQSERLLQRIK